MIEDPDLAAAVLDQALLLEARRGFAHPFAPHAEHMREKFVRHAEFARGHAIARHQQPARQPALDHVEAVARGGLLMTRDRVASGEFRMTHEFLSHMLGVRREGVSEAAAGFQQKGLIEYSRGKIRILDHRGLEAAACSCYRETPKGLGSIGSWRPAR